MMIVTKDRLFTHMHAFLLPICLPGLPLVWKTWKCQGILRMSRKSHGIWEMPGNCLGKNSVMENYWWNCRLINYYQYFLHLLLELPVIFFALCISHYGRGRCAAYPEIVREMSGNFTVRRVVTAACDICCCTDVSISLGIQVVDEERMRLMIVFLPLGQSFKFPSLFWYCWLVAGKGIRPMKTLTLIPKFLIWKKWRRKSGGTA